jgi:hypothetical protein
MTKVRARTEYWMGSEPGTHQSLSFINPISQHLVPKTRRLGDVSLILDSTFSQTGFPFDWRLTLLGLVNHSKSHNE